MIDDDPERHIGLIGLPECRARHILGSLKQTRKQVAVKVVANALKHGSPALEPPPGIDGGARQRMHSARFIAVELHENKVPEFEPAPTFAGGVTNFTHTAFGAAEVVVNF